jgi:hypothetical protein
MSRFKATNNGNIPFTQSEEDAQDIIDAEWLLGSASREIEKVQTEITQKTQKRLDDFADTRNYTSIITAALRVNSAVPKFKNDGEYCNKIMDETWFILDTILTDVASGARPIPAGYDEIEPELPALAWPL